MDLCNIMIGENMKFIDKDFISDKIRSKNIIKRLIMVLLGTFIIALIYNSFIVKYDIVYGGVGGIAIFVNHFFQIDNSLFINVVTGLLFIISFFIVGYKKAFYTLVGFISYAIMINLTKPLALYVNVDINSFFISVLFFAFICGIGYGLIYRAGFNTGGCDSIIMIIQHYFKIPQTIISNIVNSLIILFGAIIFGIEKSIYAIIFLKIINLVNDYMILGKIDHKICFIKTCVIFLL